MNKIISLITLLAVMMLMAGCDQQAQTPTNQQAPANQQAQEQQKVVEDKTATSTTANTVTKTLKDLLNGKLQKYTVDYTITTDSVEQKMTQVFDFPKYAMITKSAQGDTRTIFDGSIFVVCNSIQSSWQCFKMNVPASETVDMEKGVNDGSIVTTPAGSCSVAGETGLKYEMTDKSVTSTACYTSDGIVLEITTPETKMIATKVSRTVDSSIFQIPAEAQDLSDLMPK